MRYLIAAALTAAFITIGHHIPAPAFGSSGGTDKYGGHTPTEKSATAEYPAGVYHCHGKAGTAKRERCDMRVKIDELTAALDAATAENAQLQERLGSKTATVSAKDRELDEVLGHVGHLERRLGAAQSQARDAIRAAAMARAEAATARRDMQEAEARAAGAGPAVSSRCKDGVNAALDSGWRFSANEKAALRVACLN